jgi:hypothetical protein
MLLIDDCRAVAVHELGARGLRFDRTCAVWQRARQLPTSLFSESDAHAHVHLSAKCVHYDIARLIRFLEELGDAELRCLVLRSGSHEKVATPLPSGSVHAAEETRRVVADSLDALGARVAMLCERLRPPSKRMRLVDGPDER